MTKPYKTHACMIESLKTIEAMENRVLPIILKGSIVDVRALVYPTVFASYLPRHPSQP